MVFGTEHIKGYITQVDLTSCASTEDIGSKKILIHHQFNVNYIHVL